MIKLYYGDCLEIMDKLIEEGVKVDLIVTDPPYKVTKRGSSGNSGGMLKKEINKKGQVFKHNNIEPNEYIPLFYDLLKDGTHLYIMCNHVNLYKMLTVAKETGFHFIKSLIWDKGNKIMGQCYMSQFEYILFFRKGKHKKINKCGTSDILNVKNKKTKNSKGENLHDTEKPTELMEILISNSSNENDLIIDPFLGIGSTGIACKNLNRNFMGIELDENYFKIAQERIESGDKYNILGEI